MLVFDDCYGVSWLGMGIYLLLLIVGWFLGIIMHFGTIFMLISFLVKYICLLFVMFSLIFWFFFVELYLLNL